ncbi:MAG: ComF family protein [Winogradskyella sp.]|uniref:ComF family protein n=1 Tax=Winogradskyella sp. TaxID=1883156 RepID=UPI0017E7BABE|nr:ComF family protein [Winogradskyella sp.]MBT8245678.1 ComF family protein [Winogradskyella sp.]NNK22004.1 ComF family protein [Winogradskyella sp.]
MFQNLVNLFFPKICEACKLPLQDNEHVVCVTCRHELPITNFHFENNDALKKILYGRVKLENATSLLHFSKKGLVQELLHNLKYRGHEQIGKFLGDWLGGELQTLDAYKTIDIVVPVPLHITKRQERGYNQVTKFGQSIAHALDADYNEDVLVKIKHTKTQVFKDRVTRFDDANMRFDLGKTDNLSRMHILLVDDIITTGATIEACVLLLRSIPDVKISVATMAIAE